MFGTLDPSGRCPNYYASVSLAGLELSNGGGVVEVWRSVCVHTSRLDSRGVELVTDGGENYPLKCT